MMRRRSGRARGPGRVQGGTPRKGCYGWSAAAPVAHNLAIVGILMDSSANLDAGTNHAMMVRGGGLPPACPANPAIERSNPCSTTRLFHGGCLTHDGASLFDMDGRQRGGAHCSDWQPCRGLDRTSSSVGWQTRAATYCDHSAFADRGRGQLVSRNNCSVEPRADSAAMCQSVGEPMEQRCAVAADGRFVRGSTLETRTPTQSASRARQVEYPACDEGRGRGVRVRRHSESLWDALVSQRGVPSHQPVAPRQQSGDDAVPEDRRPGRAEGDNQHNGSRKEPSCNSEQLNGGAAHAASGEEGSGTGRAMPSGQSTPSGQLADSHLTALSRRPTVMSEPSTNRRYMTPELNKRVATRLVDSPRAEAYTSMSLIRC